MISTFEDIVGYMGEMKFMVDELKARPVYKAVNKLFLAIVAFVAGAASYLSHGVIRKSRHAELSYVA
jgi:hypothetical protein